MTRDTQSTKLATKLATSLATRPQPTETVIAHARKLRWPLALVGAWLVAAPAQAQLLRGVGGLVGGLPLSTTVGDIGQQTRSDLNAAREDLTSPGQRLARLGALERAHPRELETDDSGAVVVRGEVLALSPTPAALDAAVKAGFAVRRQTGPDALGLAIVSLSAPKGLSASQALKRLRQLDPAGQYDLDHIYSGSGEAAAAAPVPVPVHGGAPSAADARVGLLDTGIDRDHPAFATSHIEQRGFAPGGVGMGAHGTAVASLLVGKTRGFHGAAPGAALWVADVYGAGPTGGSAFAIAAGLAWMAQNKVPVINISLVGPPNLALQAAVRATLARGELIVAPVGNDGPASPPLYPAAYPGVIAVTGVDARNKVLIEACRASHVDFSARGADVAAAKPGGGFETVRGTSFASPVVAGKLALALHRPDPAAAARAVAALSREAAGLGGVITVDSPAP